MLTERKIIQKAFIHSLPVLFGYIAIGIAFGMLLVRAGYSPWIALLMSVFIYAGAGQYLAVTLFANNVSLGEVALLTFLVNSRHMVYGLSLLKKFEGFYWLKPYLIFSLTDETYALLSGIDASDQREKKVLFYVSLFDQTYWVLGTVIGALAGQLIPLNTTGLDFSLTALFVVLLMEQWKKYKTKLPFAIGGACGIAAVFLLGRQNMLLGAVIAAMVILMICRKRIETQNDAIV